MNNRNHTREVNNKKDDRKTNIRNGNFHFNEKPFDEHTRSSSENGEILEQILSDMAWHG